MVRSAAGASDTEVFSLAAVQKRGIDCIEYIAVPLFLRQARVSRGPIVREIYGLGIPKILPAPQPKLIFFSRFVISGVVTAVMTSSNYDKEKPFPQFLEFPQSAIEK